MTKLIWYKAEEGGWTDDSVDSAKVWQATYNGKEGLFSLEVYPLKLINKNAKGWEYRIIETEPSGDPNEDGIDFDSLSESSNGNDHAPDAKIAREWAENTLRDFIEERKAKNVKKEERLKI
jgi:hypothetical protein